MLLDWEGTLLVVVSNYQCILNTGKLQLGSADLSRSWGRGLIRWPTVGVVMLKSKKSG
jgi:hypothetical protein